MTRLYRQKPPDCSLCFCYTSDLIFFIQMKYGKAEGKISIQWYLKQSYWPYWAQNPYWNVKRFVWKSRTKILHGKDSPFVDALLGILELEESSFNYEEKLISIKHHQCYKEFLRQHLVWLSHSQRALFRVKLDVPKILY